MSDANAETSPPATETKALRLVPVALLGLALVWSIVIRVPLIANAKAHLDGDLAVDGLTLLEATRGEFRWHFPGTPHIGIAPLFAALPQALIFGASPETIVSGGVVVSLIVLVACFALAWACEGARAACWSLVPLTFASTGMVWLSGRMTGGHLLSVAMHAFCFLALHRVIVRPGWGRIAALGLLCGLSLWIDQMAILGIAGLIVAAGVSVWLAQGTKGLPLAALRGSRFLPLLLLGLAIGIGPRLVGNRVDGYDAYREQFSPIWNVDVLMQHGRVLFMDCLPRLVSGHRIPKLVSDPLMYTIPTSLVTGPRDRAGFFDEVAIHMALLLFVVSLYFCVTGKGDSPSFAVRLGLIVTSVLVIVGFIINRNIFNSDNYRYLVYLIVPWSIGFGRAMDRLSSKGSGGAFGAGLLCVAFAIVMTLDVSYWYTRFGWMKDGRPVTAELSLPVVEWLEKRTDIDGLVGSYWDVYKICFLMGGRIKVIPYATYPNRFPEWTSAWPMGRPHFLLMASQRDGGSTYRANAMNDGGVELFRAGMAAVYSWPDSVNQR